MQFLRYFLSVICVISVQDQAIEGADYRNVRFGPRQDESIERVMLPNLSFKECLKQFVLRWSCEVMGYFRAALLCELHFFSHFWDSLASSENGPRVMVYVKRSDIVLEDVETCDDKDNAGGHCVKNECRPFAKVPNGTILGNLYFDGTKRLLKCDNGYVPKDGTNVISMCKKGQWTNITQCVQEECVLNQGTFGGSTYTFAIKSRRNYNDSVAFCKHCGYRVVTIESDDEHNYLKDKMRGFFPSPASYHGTGEYDGFFLDFYETGRQVFRMDNHTAEVQFVKWGMHEPDSEAQKFIAVVGWDAWHWHDAPPDVKFQTVCEN
ncbi:hypothetical protein DPMN_133265 [Dreissena polymorpha]|uniref:C-type lectin domain-containing protein n=1 Tax=Dreissena polymorpha TaxID=45954 RepID=A0A9D4FXK1_DREPO|nr:hypothetical protein DPMN_133265 [Dreissena polymorpha]